MTANSARDALRAYEKMSNLYISDFDVTDTVYGCRVAGAVRLRFVREEE